MQGAPRPVTLASIGSRLVLVLLCSVSVHAQTLETSSAYPLQARIVKVETRTGSSETSRVYTDPTTGEVSGSGSGGTYTWHLMKAIIGNTLYGLSVVPGATIYGIGVQHRAWLEIGVYPAKQVKNGFEFQYVDSSGKVRHEVLHIESEEPAPDGQLIPTTKPYTEVPDEKPSHRGAALSAQTLQLTPSSHNLDQLGIQTGNDLLVLCATPEDSPDHDFNSAVCTGYILGVQDSLGEFSVSGVKTPFPLCFGSNPPTHGQSKDIVVKFLNENPAIRSEDAAVVVMGALSQAFRCGKSGKKPKGE